MNAAFEIDEFKALDHEGNQLFTVTGEFYAECEWSNQNGRWYVERLFGAHIEVVEGKRVLKWNRIDDVPECKAIVRGAEAYIANNEPPEGGYTDPNAEHRLTAADLGVGRFA